jgi:hypothetical protein
MSDTVELVTIGCDDVTETEEEILARTQRFELKKRELEGYVEEFTEEWYRLKYPGFPDEFYPLFVQASVVENNIDQQ